MASYGTEAGRDLEDKVRQTVAFIEATTGLRSRWNGTVRVVDATTASLLSPTPFFAKKEWGCGITLLETTLGNDGLWRSLLHEALHSVSVGLTEQSYQQFAPWEEAVVEGLQRILRPEFSLHLGIVLDESRLEGVEAIWRYNSAVEAVQRIARERPEMSLQEFLEQMLGTRLPDRPAFAFEWGRQCADFQRFKRVYAAASGNLR